MQNFNITMPISTTGVDITFVCWNGIVIKYYKTFLIWRIPQFIFIEIQLYIIKICGIVLIAGERVVNIIRAIAEQFFLHSVGKFAFGIFILFCMRMIFWRDFCPRILTRTWSFLSNVLLCAIAIQNLNIIKDSNY